MWKLYQVATFFTLSWHSLNPISTKCETNSKILPHTPSKGGECPPLAGVQVSLRLCVSAVKRMSLAGGGAGGGIKYFTKKCKEITDKVLMGVFVRKNILKSI
ncbi:MAG: hypothetical protein A2W17_01530 [Planctomycetes bacterium RBG_16_41_13]|nr:MAG: hypothetical protein A2W17_01530 [Planctomycetes bacterium RBG_16_41_13]